MLDFSKCKIIDLSYPVHPAERELVCDDFVERVIMDEVIWPLETVPSYVDNTIYQIVKFKTHLRTHIEAPLHINGRGIPLNELPVDTFIGRCVRFYFDVPERHIITLDEFKQADNGRLKEGDIVIVHTNHHTDENYMPVYESWPKLDIPVGDYLLEKKIKMLGIDWSIGFVQDPENEDANCHNNLLLHNVPLLEILNNLDKVTEDITFISALPGLAKVEGVYASPVQAVIIEGTGIE